MKYIQHARIYLLWINSFPCIWKKVEGMHFSVPFHEWWSWSQPCWDLSSLNFIFSLKDGLVLISMLITIYSSFLFDGMLLCTKELERRGAKVAPATASHCSSLMCKHPSTLHETQPWTNMGCLTPNTTTLWCISLSNAFPQMKLDQKAFRTTQAGWPLSPDPTENSNSSLILCRSYSTSFFVLLSGQ